MELEDTIAQLNVAAAQLYRVEYEQMKVRTRPLWIALEQNKVGHAVQPPNTAVDANKSMFPLVARCPSVTRCTMA